jgi:biotin carboxylase
MAVAAQINVDFPESKLVISPNEYSQYAAAVIRAVIDPSADSMHTTLCTRDKALMKAVMREHNVPVASGFSLRGYDAEAAISRIKSELSFPLILKPRSAMSSQGVFKIANDDELKWCVGSLSQDKLNDYLCEQYIEADEYFVDALWTEGRDWLLLVGKYETPMLDVAAGKALVVSRYVNRAENKEVYDRIVDVSRQAAAACGVRSGVTHTEFFVDRDSNVYLGEMATRMGGGPHEELAKWATGRSLGELQARALLGDLEETPPENLPMSKEVFGYINLQPHRPGTVARVMSEQQALSHPGILRVTKSVKPGDKFNLNGSSSWFFSCVMKAETVADFDYRKHSLCDSFFSQLEMS